MVPFFGDQPFWGAACARMGVGPKPIPIDKLETPLLVDALNFMLKPEVQAAAKETGAGIKHVRNHYPSLFALSLNPLVALVVTDMPSQEVPCTGNHLTLCMSLCRVEPMDRLQRVSSIFICSWKRL